VVLGLDTRFLGGKRERKNKGKSKGNEISRFAPAGFASAFGRAEALFALVFTAHVNV
jgi:hypothetical protein